MIFEAKENGVSPAKKALCHEFLAYFLSSKEIPFPTSDEDKDARYTYPYRKFKDNAERYREDQLRCVIESQGMQTPSFLPDYSATQIIRLSRLLLKLARKSSAAFANIFKSGVVLRLVISVISCQRTHDVFLLEESLAHEIQDH